MQRVNRIYKSNPAHRNGTRGHTQWLASISVTDEKKMFLKGVNAHWEADGSIFSFLSVNDFVLRMLDCRLRLNFARFIGASSWHGFPADVKLYPKDLPSYQVLSEWEGCGITTRAKIAKLRRRQSCAI
jgi:hypothetical protein